MTSRAVGVLLALTAVVAVVAGVGWYSAHLDAYVSHTQLVSRNLEPVAALIAENQHLIEELRSAPFTEKDVGILASYLAKIRRDGVGKHADMKRILDQLADNNSAIVTLIKVYAPQAKTPVFTAEADKYRNYVSAWRDRWNSVMELFMLGGNYPASEPPFPTGLAEAVQAEIAAAT